MTSEANVEFGTSLKEHFLFDPTWRNLNNGSFGAMPRYVREKQLEFQNRAESRPDEYIRYEYPKALDASRTALSAHLNVSPNTVVFVANATTAFNIILRNIRWAADGKDEVISFSTIYGACNNTVEYIVDTNPGLVSSRTILLTYPLEDEDIITLFREAVTTARAEGRRPRVAVYDVVSSQPGVRFPFEALTAVCRELGVLSLVDGAQGVGMIKLDLAALDADFFLSNCHKWLHTPRGCAFLHVPFRNQGLIRSTLPTSRGYVPLRVAEQRTPVPAEEAGAKSAWVTSFDFVGTLDNSQPVVVKDALQWRQEVLGGEERILEYLWWLAKEGGKKTAAILGTGVIDNKTETLTNCAMVNVWLPVKSADVQEGALGWAQEVLVKDYRTFIPLSQHNGQWYTRLSAQVYLDLEDFEWAGRALKEVCERVVREKAKKRAPSS
ncbi:lolT-1 [Dactylonectria estremocensis]|uniref:LolT-1 n=1 Tax=Dactylonectria estremocensis TaxID=1079267 RepID=A0A9P9E5I1_9HYPO|nr:lolT-1 [Dactylonectria estremocensis]